MTDVKSLQVGIWFRDRKLRQQPLYWQLGFEPLVSGDPEREVWERVIRLLSGEDGGGPFAPLAG